MTNDTAAGPTTDDRPWFASWFDSDYLRVYGHRDEQDAAAGVALFDRAVPLAVAAPVLDLACGNGRHLEQLLLRGYGATGLDLSAELLVEARRQVGDDVRLVRGDMRAIPLGSGTVAAVTSFFTSFGYFDDTQNQLVLTEIARVLQARGTLFLDYVNRAPTLNHLVARSERTVGAIEVIEQRRWNEHEQRVEKLIELRSADGHRTIRESVRLYTPEELGQRCAAAGLITAERFGDTSGASFDPKHSPRLIVRAVKQQ